MTAFLLFVCQQLSGINAVVYFSTQIFRDAGVTSAVLSSLLVMLVNVAGTAFVAAPLIDRFGRTTMLSASYAGMATSMAVMGACLAQPALAGTSLLTAITLLGTVAYVFAFSCGSGPVPSSTSITRTPLGSSVPSAVRLHASSLSASSFESATARRVGGIPHAMITHPTRERGKSVGRTTLKWHSRARTHV